MIKVRVLKEDAPYAHDYDAWLTGWVVYEGRVMAMIVEDDLDFPWMIHQSRIEVYVPEV